MNRNDQSLTSLLNVFDKAIIVASHINTIQPQTHVVPTSIELVNINTQSLLLNSCICKTDIHIISCYGFQTSISILLHPFIGYNFEKKISISCIKKSIQNVDEYYYKMGCVIIKIRALSLTFMTVEFSFESIVSTHKICLNNPDFHFSSTKAKVVDS